MPYRLIIGIVIILLSVLHTGCLRTYYPAIYQSSAPPLVYDHCDSLGSESSFAAADFTASEGDHGGESAYLVRLTWLKAVTREHTNFNLRYWGYGGTYTVAGLEWADEYYNSGRAHWNGTKWAFGLGADAAFSLNFRIDDVKIGVGSAFGACYEAGSYADFRKETESRGITDSHTGGFIVLVSLFQTTNIRLSETSSISAQISVGIPGGITPALSFHSGNTIIWAALLPDFRDSKAAHRFSLGVILNMNSLPFSF